MLGSLRALRSCSSSLEGIFDTSTLEWGVAGILGSEALRYSTGHHKHRDARIVVLPLAQRKEATLSTSVQDASIQKTLQ